MLVFISGFFSFLKTAIFLVGYISNSALFPEPLTPEEETEVLKKYMEGDEESRNILIERNLRLVAHICKKYNIPNIENEDLISIGTIGLIKGINTFSLEKGVRLATYAARCIENEILMYLRSTKKLGSEVHLNEPIGKDKDDNEISLMDILENDDKAIEDEIDFKMKIKKVYEKMKEVLKGREKTILELRFGLTGNKPQTQNEVAKLMGISRSYVSRIETKAINKLAKEMQE
ncbi:MAG: RNA polymerase sporulation sigma factor SigK [Clostridiales bacterium]|nr:RNA polymerase sporulation sigma factor SigK [Clostridiales bacterium]